MEKCSSFAIFLLVLFFNQTARLCSSMNSSFVCITGEREALVKFKQSLEDPDLVLSSWQTTNCCQWKGVACSTTTGHVIKLDLSLQPPYNYLVGHDINYSLLELRYLNYLDLSGVYFQGIPIPKLIGSMQQLRYLNLASPGFRGVVPHQLGNLTNLRVLDLSGDVFNQLTIQNLEWISGLSSLHRLDMSHIYIGGEQNLMQVLNTLPCLLVLRLSGCSLNNTHISQTTNSSHRQPFFQNMTSLTTLDLSQNHFSSSIPFWFVDLKSLVHLDLSRNGFEDGFSALLWNSCKIKTLDLSLNRFHGSLLGNQRNSSTCLKKLKQLDLAFNSFNGSIPTWMGELSALRKLDLSSNQLNGEIPDSLGQLVNLERLYLSNNSLEGIVSEVHFANLSRLKELDMGHNQLVIKLKSNWLPPFQLEFIGMDFCKIGSQLPQWLRTQKQLESIVLSNASITGPIPQWFKDMHLLQQLDLSYNQIDGQFPTLPSNLIFLDLSYNFISGTLPKTIHDMLPMFFLHLANNLLNGTIPNWFCNIRTLDLSNNNISGNIPSCWTEISILVSINLSSNKLIGTIPTSIGQLSLLQRLHLNNNNLEGELPLALRNCTELQVLDLGDNNLSGNIPKWIGKNVLFLEILRLRNNAFNGIIPLQICQLFQLKILDLAHNNLIGTIPHCFAKLSAMLIEPTRNVGSDWNFRVVEVMKGRPDWNFRVVEVIKGRELEYTSESVQLLVNMDLSSNNLVGMIPAELTLLRELVSLNLSHNHLTGTIPKNIGNLTSLESLDLSTNQLSNFIPQSIADITSLSHLNLSHNNLSGQIPTGSQLQTFNDPSIYAANPQLCGAPLPKKCQLGDEPPQARMPEGYKENLDEEDKNEKVWFYMVVTVGYTTGLATVVGVLLLNKRWRLAYFQFVDQVKEWMLLTIALKAARLKKMIRRNHTVE